MNEMTKSSTYTKFCLQLKMRGYTGKMVIIVVIPNCTIKITLTSLFKNGNTMEY